MTSQITSLQPVGGAFLIENVAPDSIFIPERFTVEDRLIGKTAEDFLRNSVLPLTERIESGDHALMHDLMRQAGELGLLGADVPEIYGGLGLPHTTAALIAEKLNFQQSFALTHEAHTVIATLPLLYFGNHDQKSRYLPKLASGEWVGSFALSEANSGSDALGLQTKAVLNAEGTHYLLNGEKMWITNTAFASLFTVFARVNDRITAFLVERETPGVSFGKEEHKLGMHGTSTRRVILENALVPVANALEMGKGHYAALCALNIGRFKLEAGAVGGLKGLLAVCATYAQQRKAFGKPIASYGMIQHKLAEMAARTFALESMVYRLAGDLERAFADIVPDAPDASQRYHRAAEEYAIECNVVKVIGSETYSQTADEAIQIHGGYGYTEEFPVARAWRDQRLLRIGEGANEIVRLAIVNTLLRRDKAGRLPLLSADPTIHSESESRTFARDSATSSPLSELYSAALQCKELALIMLQQAIGISEDSDLHSIESGVDLAELQEVTAAIADVVCSAYALDSLYLRCAQIVAHHPARASAALAAALVARIDYVNEAVNAATYFVDSLSLPADLYDGLLDEMRTFGNPLHLRRNLAALVLEANGYPA